ncbi:MAG TPA: methyltransferase domain-containing protein [Flavobacteriales bacterium]|nr:methyltransferase domain-containing protein [Flavobacteriales bacterium]
MSTLTCDTCVAVDSFFSGKRAKKKYKKYLKSGADQSTKKLIAALIENDVEGITLLDIGGGLGAIHHELIEAGASSAKCADASADYIAISKTEGERRNHSEKLSYHYGNYIDLAEELGSADIVTLDKVICCFDDMKELVAISSSKATELYALIFPRNKWWTRLIVIFGNMMFALLGKGFRIHLHPEKEVEAVVEGNGFERVFYYNNILWQVIVYGKKV